MVDLSSLVEHFTYMTGDALYHVGETAAKELYEEKLKGILHPRSFNYWGTPLSPKGKRMVSFSLAKNNSVIVRSYPMNVYRAKGETGPRSAKRTAGRGIFRSFESGFDAAGAAETALEYILRNSEVFKPKENKGWNTRMQK
ncbi:MAG: hypothetical protein LBT00_08550 [Spirochaetaceae bacterium]|nr:hypothetical protein [Spirochaetaceae bacterium]